MRSRRDLLRDELLREAKALRETEALREVEALLEAERDIEHLLVEERKGTQQVTMPDPADW